MNAYICLTRICLTCHWWDCPKKFRKDGNEADKHRCMVNPPTVLESTSAAWPKPEGDDWCKQWQQSDD